MVRFIGRIIKEVSPLFFGLALLLLPLCAYSQGGSVEMNVFVRERKPTDTMNDFDFSAMGATPAAASSGQVLGVQSTRKKSDNRISAGLFIKLYFAGLPCSWHPAFFLIFTKY